MTEKETAAVLPQSITRGLTDKLVERRKGAALELERLVKDLLMMNDNSQIKQVIFALKDEFTLTSNPNSRKGGLVGLAATAIALGKPAIGVHLPELVQPVLVCFEDQDARVRYYACEALYNISKVARVAILVFFNTIFEGLIKATCDADSNVRYGAELLDRLMKDIVSENPHFDIDNFIVLLRNSIYTNNGFAKTFLVSWISFLDSIPDMHMHEHLPEFLDGLFTILGDPRKEIKKMAQDTLGELLKELEQHSNTVRFYAMTNILAVHSQSEDHTIQTTALTWLKTFLDLAQRNLLMFTPHILIAILPCMSYEGEKASIREVALAVNERLKKLIIPEDDKDSLTDEQDQLTPITPARTLQQLSAAARPQPANISPRSAPKSGHEDEGEGAHQASSTIALKEPPKLHLLPVLAVLLNKTGQQETRLESLRWLLWLHQQIPKRIYNQAGKLFLPLLEMLTDPSDKVLRMALKAIAVLSTSKASLEVEPPPVHVHSTEGLSQAQTADVSSRTHLNKYFRLFLVELLRMFNSNRVLLDNKGPSIIRQLCVDVNAHPVYCTLAEILNSEENLTFASLMVQVLNMILFTSAELYELRTQLKDLHSTEDWCLFKTLYQCWCHNPVTTLALCLLSQNYEHSSHLICKFTDLEITAGFLKELDKLVQLLESPIFAFLRLQILEPHQNPHLLQTLYGVLMLLPQTTAFETLRQRLSCVPVMTVIHMNDKPTSSSKKIPLEMTYDELLANFVAVQQRHSAYRKTAIQGYRIESASR
ncbi:hypothetical protein EMCRGX_G030989 [Ephydatia muelleri]